MPIDPELAALMVDTVTVEEPTGTTNSGRPTYVGASLTSYTCRVEGKVRMVRDAEMKERRSTVTVYLDRPAEISPNARVTLPMRWTPRQPPIIHVKHESDEVGPYFTVVYC